MSFLKTLNRRMERNQAARMALLELFEQSSIGDMDDFSESLWRAISESQSQEYYLEILNTEELPFEFIVKLLIKIGFSCDNAARLIINMHRKGELRLAFAERELLISLDGYLQAQASRHGVTLLSRILKR